MHKIKKIIRRLFKGFGVWFAAKPPVVNRSYLIGLYLTENNRGGRENHTKIK
jgi:hypothetical protein